MAIVREDFHGVPNTTNVSTSNAPNLSGVLINVGTGPGTAKGDSTNLIHGVNSLKVIGTVAASDVAYVFISGSDATGSMHDYIIFPGSVPSAAVQLMVMRGVSSGPNVCIFAITAGNKFNIQDAGGVTKKTFANTVVANQLYRLEMASTPGTGTGDGTIQGAYYLDELTSLPAGETAYSATNVNAGTVAIGQYRFGKPNSGGTINCNISDVAANAGTLAEIGVISSGTDYVKSIDDPVGVTDSGAPQTIDRGTTVADPVGATDTAVDVESVVAGPADPAGVTDAAAAVSGTSRTQADPVGVTDSASTVAAATRVTADPVAMTDAASTVAAVIATPADPAAVTDTASAVAAAVRGQDDPAGITDTATSQLDRAAPLNDPTGITDAATTVTAATQTAADPIGATDSVSYTLTATPEQSITDNAGITDAVTVVVVSTTSPADPIGIIDATSTARGASPADTAGIADAVTWVYTAARTAADPLGMTDAATAVLSFGPVLADPVGLTDTATIERGSVTSAADQIGVTDAVTVAVDAAAAVDDAAGVIDEVSVVRVGIIEITVTNSVGMTDFANWHLSTGRNITVDAQLVPQTSKYGATLEEQS